MKYAYIIVFVFLAISIAGFVGVQHSHKSEIKKSQHFYDKGLKYYKDLDVFQAIDSFTQAIEHDSHNANAYYNRGVILANMGTLPDAIDDFKNAIQFNPKMTSAYYNTALAYEELDKNKQAVKYFKLYLKHVSDKKDPFIKYAEAKIKELESM